MRGAGGSVTIEDGQYGPRAVLTTPWEPAFEKHLKSREVVELELNDGKGWRGVDVEFLRLFPELRSFTIVDLRIDSVAPIHDLHRLQKLKVVTYCRTPIDFAAFPDLVDCGLECRTGAESLFDCIRLKHLFVNRCRERTFDRFARLENPESLIVLSGPLQSLGGIERLQRLTHLRLGNLRSLRSLDGLEDLGELNQLEIQVCGRIDDISAIAGLGRLKTLLLESCGDIASLRPVSQLTALETLVFDGTTHIVDGDLTLLLGLKKLRKVSFQNRRHYSHRREDIRALLGG